MILDIVTVLGFLFGAPFILSYCFLKLNFLSILLFSNQAFDIRFEIYDCFKKCLYSLLLSGGFQQSHLKANDY